jgi:aldoxime dehydratase
MPLVSAIPDHLKVERTRPLMAPADFEGPTTNSHCTYFDTTVEEFVVLYIGVQRKPGANIEPVLETIKFHLQVAGHVETGQWTDPQGYDTTFVIAYWRKRKDYETFAANAPVDWWYANLDPNGPIGVSFERYTPNVRDIETTYSHQKPEGWGHIADYMTEPTDTHEYWGSMVDRIARSQTEDLTPEGTPAVDGLALGHDTLGRFVRVTPHNNLCVLRSGQDWTEAKGKDLTKFTKGIQPKLEIGMNELKNEGVGKKCYFNRFITLDEGNGMKTISYSSWHSIYDLSKWITGQTHMAIFSARKSQFGNEGSDVALYHENMVLRSGRQEFAYFNCHKETGMLRHLGVQ